MDERERIGEFWRWWATRADDIAAAVDGDGGFELAPEMTEHVERLHPDLQWEFGRGFDSRHALCVTAGGNPTLRSLAERWVRAAPSADVTWSYRPARIADPSVLNARLDFAGRSLFLGETRVAFEIDEERQLVHVQVHNPVYRKLPEDARGEATFLFLDWLLGEDGAGRWLGEVGFPKRAPRGAVPAPELAEAVNALAARDEEPHWVLMQINTPGGVTFVNARRPLKWIDHPLLDLHLAVVISYEPRSGDDSGLPESEEMERFTQIEDELLAIGGDDILLAATETHRGRRTLHVYVDSEDTAVVEGIRAWAAGVPRVAVELAADPGWYRVREFV